MTITKIIRTAPREVLLTRENYLSTAKALVALNKSRRATVEWVAETLFKAEEDGFIILTGEGQRLFIHEDVIEEIFGDDPDYTSVSDLKRKAENPPRRTPRRGLLRRLQWYFACFALAGRGIRREDRWIEAQRMRRLIATFSPVRLVHYRKAVRDVKRRMGKRPNPILYSQAIRALRFRFWEEQEHWNNEK